MITWAQISLQDGVSPIIEEFAYFHDFTIVILVFILRAVGFIMVRILKNLFVNRGLLEGQAVECIWTVIPAIVLVQIAVPSLTLLYLLDETERCSVTLKILGHQWYWSYEYSDFWSAGKRVEFDRYIRPETGSPKRNFRLLDVDNRTVLPFRVHIRGLVRSADVLHSWAVPAIGVKADACPGRLNQIKLFGHRPGVVYGQCSEICGANHRFMPIALELVPSENFLSWVSLQREI